MDCISVSIQDSPIGEPVKNAICDSSTLKKLDLPKPKKPLDLLRFQPHFFFLKNPGQIEDYAGLTYCTEFTDANEATAGAPANRRCLVHDSHCEAGWGWGAGFFPRGSLWSFPHAKGLEDQSPKNEMYFGVTYFEGKNHIG